uniref:Uncharacterized protein n=1 Tax=Bionectria ochroleuca TaxID=29856 RepID=A0A8H7K626_BIOOC
MPQINLALKQFYRKHPESVEISLESVGPSPAMTKPTVLVVCTSVGKVRAILKKRVGDLFDESTGFALKVCRGQVLRSRRDSSFPVRSMANRSHVSADNADDGEIDAINPEFQQRPGNGASIGAWIGDRHLPPVSFGGLVLVDDKVYGMTVHHMLDDPDRDFGQDEPTRSSAVPGHEWFDQSVAGSSADDDFSYELSDTESEAYSESDITSDWGDDEDEDEDSFEPGDIPGIEPGCGADILSRSQRLMMLRRAFTLRARLRMRTIWIPLASERCSPRAEFVERSSTGWCTRWTGLCLSFLPIAFQRTISFLAQKASQQHNQRQVPFCILLRSLHFHPFLGWRCSVSLGQVDYRLARSCLH